MLGSESAFSLAELPELMDAHQRVGLWVIDPLPAAWDPDYAFGYNEEYAAGHRVKVLADAHDAAVVVTGHAGKRWDQNPVTAGTGTVGLPGAADNRWLIQRRPQGRALLHLGGGRGMPSGGTLTLSFDGTRFQLLGSSGVDGAKESMPVTELSQQRLDILDALRSAGEPLTPKQVAESLGLNDSRGREAVKALMWKMKGRGQVASDAGRYSVA